MLCCNSSLVSKQKLPKTDHSKMVLQIFLLWFCLSATSVNSSRILAYFPTPSISHQVVFRPYTHELAKRGHQVTVITTDPVFPPDGAPENLTEIDLHDLSYGIWSKLINSNDLTKGKNDDLVSQVSTILRLFSSIFEKQIQSKEVQEIIGNKTKNFDLLIVEAVSRPALALSHHFKVPLILFCSLGGFGNIYDVMGAPSRPTLLYPTNVRQRITNLSLMDKIYELYNNYRLESIMQTLDEDNNKLNKRLFGPDTPDLKELDNNVNLIFLNVHPIWEWNRPVPPGIVYTGGLHQKPAKELPAELKSYLDSSKHGVIYISFGTNVSPSHLPPEKIQTMINVCSQLPYDVLWKWDRDELPGRSKNIRISKWFPQSDMLKHPNIKMFITQGGLQSTDEAITAGVPLLGMPMLGDQWYNVEMYVHHKIGLRIDMDTLTEDTFKNAINTLINDESYQKNIVKLRSIMHDQPESALTRAVWWTEHVLRHGGARHLRAPAANMSWTEYLDIELVLSLATVALITLIALYMSINLLINFVRIYILRTVKSKQS